MIALLFGFVIAVSPGLKTALFSPKGSLLWLSSAATTLGTPMVGMMALIVGATLGLSLRRVSHPRPGPGPDNNNNNKNPPKTPPKKNVVPAIFAPRCTRGQPSSSLCSRRVWFRGDAHMHASMRWVAALAPGRGSDALLI